MCARCSVGSRLVTCVNAGLRATAAGAPSTVFRSHAARQEAVTTHVQGGMTRSGWPGLGVRIF